jgi:hypothetical protein
MACCGTTDKTLYVGCGKNYDGGLDSIPESDPIPQTDKGGIFMNNGKLFLSRLRERVFRAKGLPLARMYRLCCGMKLDGFGISVIPGIFACNISFRAGGSGQTHHKFLLGYG